jgi:glyoxylase-like metal-dependent hydrolase (beta-lactamase superfamily II)
MAAGYYQIHEYHPGIFRITSEEHVISDLLVGQNQSLLIDTGYGFGDLRAAVNSITQLPLIVVNTHGHLDHVDGNGQFADCPIYLHPSDQLVYEKYFEQANRQLAVERSRHARIAWGSSETRNILPRDFDESVYTNACRPNTRPLTDGQRFDLGGVVLRVCHLPGHTYGSCGLLNESTLDFYVGDAANAHVLISIDGATVDIYKKTLAKLAMLDFKVFMQGHVLEPVDKSSLQDYIDCANQVGIAEPCSMPSPFDAGTYNMVYVRPGYLLNDIAKPGYAILVTNEQHIR